MNDTNCVALNEVAGALEAEIIISPQAGNGIQCLTDGLFCPATEAEYGTALPGSPDDGDEFYFQADKERGVIWRLKYVALERFDRWGDFTLGSLVVTGLDSTILGDDKTEGLYPGQVITGGRISAGTTITSVSPSLGNIAMSQVATGTGNGSIFSSAWDVIGPPLLRRISTHEQLGSDGAYADLATVGPTLTTPLKGSYRIAGGATGVQPNSAATDWSVGIKVGAAATVELTTYRVGAAAVVADTGSSEYGAVGVAAGTVCKLQYITSMAANRPFFRNRWLTLQPIRVG
jgi:hypothetical protein